MNYKVVIVKKEKQKPFCIGEIHKGIVQNAQYNCSILWCYVQNNLYV